MPNLQEELTALLKDALAEGVRKGDLKSAGDIPIILNIPTQKEHGDYATPLVLSLAKKERVAPQKLASLLVSILNQLPSSTHLVEKIEIAGPGYINFFIKKEVSHGHLLEILRKGTEYGKTDLFHGQKILIEFVSANPTGPLHVAHGRAAALGDAMTRLLRAVGYQVDQEYYINDVGNQMALLGQSTYLRYRELCGEKIDLPAESYKGDYIIDIAKEAATAATGMSLPMVAGVTTPTEEVLLFFTQYSYQKILSLNKETLKSFGIYFDSWFSESVLHQENKVSEAILSLRESGFVYDADGAVWVATTRYGDDKDRVIQRSNGELTYFASDIAYHKNKLARGYDRLIDIWGADHHGYIVRVKAAVIAMGYAPERLDIVIHQLVNLLRAGKPVAMSKRSGEFVTLKEVIEEVGVDATRFFFTMRRSDTSLDFDLEIAKKTSDENPVYYIQYAYARLCSIIRVAKEQGHTMEKETDVSLLLLPEEMELIKQLSLYPHLVKMAAERLEPHRINFYLMELAGMVHRYYFKCRIVTEDAALTKARLGLISGIQIVLKSALDLLGVSAPERM
jgi:arginyl-tRNA synthetase